MIVRERGEISCNGGGVFFGPYGAVGTGWQNNADREVRIPASGDAGATGLEAEFLRFHPWHDKAVPRMGHPATDYEADLQLPHNLSHC